MRVLTVAALLVSVLGTSHIYAMAPAGAGQGKTKIDFQFDTVDVANSRLFAKIDVSAALSQLGNSGGKSHNDDLAGYTLKLSIGPVGTSPSTFEAVCDSKGKTMEDLNAVPPVPFTAKLTANGKILQIMAEGLNLKSMFGIDPALGDGSVTIEIDVSASKTDSNNVTTTVPLSAQAVTFNYKVKKTTVKGSNH